MSVFYKFKSSLTHDTIQFDDLHISLQDFKKAVIQQKQLGKNTNFDLQVTNAETNEVYSEENSLIPKNSSLIVVRIPIAGTQKKSWDIGDQLGSKIGVLSSDYLQENAGNIVVKSADLAALNATEDDKIQAMMFQSTVDYDPSNYLRVKGGSQYGDPPQNYVCHKCHHPGHWIKDCPITVVPDIKKSSGIPQSFMTPVDGPSVPGALMTPTGTFAVPTIDLHAYKEGKKEKPFIPSEETEEVVKPIIPEDLLCALCQDLLTDAVMMPCCGNSFCDDCIRNVLIESDENQCPDCKEKDTSPETLIPNRFLRNAVNTFRNKTGYRGGGQCSKQTNAKSEPEKSPIIENENDDVEIIATIPNEPVPKVESEPENEKGSAIAVLGSGGVTRRSGGIQTNGAQNKMPNIHLEHRPPMGRPKPVPGDGRADDSPRNMVSNGINPSSDSVMDADPPKPAVMSHAPPPVIPDRSRMSGPPPPLNPANTSQAPPGYNQGAMPPMGALFPGGPPPMMPNYGPPPGVNPMVMPPQHMGTQPGVRMYHNAYPGQTMYPQMNDRGYRAPGNRMRMQGDNYNDRNIVEDPWEAFERHLKEREKQDRLRRNRSRRSRSRSHSRGKTRSVSRSRSRSRTPLKQRSHSKSPPPARKESSTKRESRSPVANRRSKSKSRSRTRLRTRSRSPPRSNSHSPGAVNMSKKKRSISISPPGPKKRSRSPSPMSKKPLRSNRTRSRTRSRSRSRKRRRTRTRSRSASSRRSYSRGRSYSRSVSPRNRRYYSPNHGPHRMKRHSRSPSRHHAPPRYRSSNYRDGSPFTSGSYYEPNEYRGFRRGGRNPRYQRGGGRYSNSNQNYDYGNKHERYGNDRYDDKRYADNNSRGYYGNNDHSRNRNKEPYYPPPMESYNQYANAYPEVAPPGTTDPIPTMNYNTNVPFTETNNVYNTRNDKYRSPDYVIDNPSYLNQNFKPVVEDDWQKRKSKDHDHYRRKSREKYHHADSERDRRHDSRSHYVSPSPNRSDKKRRSHDRSRDKENKSRYESSGKRESVEKFVDHGEKSDRVVDSKPDFSPEKEKSRKDDDKKDDHKEKKDKSKRKKKKESETEKKKKKKVKAKKEDESKGEEHKLENEEKESFDVANEEKVLELDVKETDLYDNEDTKVDKKIIEDYGKIEISDEPAILEKTQKNENLILASVPELSKWERDDEISPDDAKALASDSSAYDDKKVVTTEILKRAENALFQKGAKVTGKSSETKNEVVVPKEKDEIISLESSREARKSGNSIQVTVPVNNVSKSEDESKTSLCARISAKDRLGAKVEEKNILRSLVEPKVKPRPCQPALKSVVDVKHSSKADSHKHEKHEESKTRKHEDRKKKESSRHSDTKHSKHRDSKESKEKRRRKSSDEESKSKKEIIKEKGDVVKENQFKEDVDESNKVGTQDVKKDTENPPSEIKSLLEKKRPSLDEASFEPDYDLTSESEEEGESKSNRDEQEDHAKKSAPEPIREVKQGIDKALIQKIIEHTNDLSSSESSSDSSSDSSVERKKRKKKKSKKRKKTKKRRTYSSDSDTEESSDSDSDSDTKHKRKKKHKHKNKKSRIAKKKKKTKHKS